MAGATTTPPNGGSSPTEQPRPTARAGGPPKPPAMRPPGVKLPATKLEPTKSSVKVGPPKLAQKVSASGAAQEDAKPYWLGTLPAFPFFNWTAPGGVRFVRWSEKVAGDSRVKTSGQVVFLTDSQLERTLKGVQQHVLRNPQNMTGQARILNVDDQAYRVDPADVPVGGFVFCYPLDPDNLHNRPTLDPQPLCEPTSLGEAAAAEAGKAAASEGAAGGGA